MSHLASHVGSVNEHVCIVLRLIRAHACGPVLEVRVVCVDIAHHSIVPLHGRSYNKQPVVSIADSATVKPNHLQSQHQPMQHGFRREQLSFMAILEHRCTFKTLPQSLCCCAQYTRSCSTCLGGLTGSRQLTCPRRMKVCEGMCCRWPEQCIPGSLLDSQ